MPTISQPTPKVERQKYGGVCDMLWTQVAPFDSTTGINASHAMGMMPIFVDADSGDLIP